MMMARIGEPTPEQMAALEKADKAARATSTVTWLAIGGGALFLYMRMKGKGSHALSN
jgi:hypothetical protein